MSEKTFKIFDPGYPKWFLPVIISTGALTIVALVLAVVFFMTPAARGNGVITVDLDENASQTIPFNKLNLAPGEQSEYKVFINRKGSGSCKVAFALTDISSSGLDSYVYIKIADGERIICDKLLKQFLADGDFTATIDNSSSDKPHFTITYYMDDSIGNEAQNAALSFNLLLTAVNN